MVIYYLNHPGFLAWVITHRLTQYPNEKAILIVENFPEHPDTFSLGVYLQNNTEFKDNGIFDEILFPDRINRSSQVDFNELITKTFDGLLDKHDIRLSEAVAIITIVDFFNDFGIYLALKNVKFFLAEPMPEYFSSRYKAVFKDSVKKLFPNAYRYIALLEETGATYGDNPLITPILLTQSTNCFPTEKKIERFDYYSTISQISEIDSQRVLAAYKINTCFSSKEKNCLIVLRSLGELTASDLFIPDRKEDYDDKFNSYHFAHQILLDYYTDDSYTIVLKPHPACPINQDKLKYYNDAKSFPAFFPVDFFKLLPEMQNYKFDLIINVGSSASDKISPHGKKVLNISNGVYYAFQLHHRFYAVMRIIDENLSGYNICLNMINYESTAKTYITNQFQSLLNILHPSSTNFNIMSEKISCFEQEIVYIVDKYDYDNDFTQMLLAAPSSAVAVFLNSNNEFRAFLDMYPELSQYIVPITITKEKIKQDVLENMKEETIAIFCKSEKLRDNFTAVWFEKTLAFAGINLTFSAITNESWLIQSLKSESIKRKELLELKGMSALAVGIKSKQQSLNLLYDFVIANNGNTSKITGWTFVKGISPSDTLPYIAMRKPTGEYVYFNITKRYSSPAVKLVYGDTPDAEECGFEAELDLSAIENGEISFGIVMKFGNDYLEQSGAEKKCKISNRLSLPLGKEYFLVDTPPSIDMTYGLSLHVEGGCLKVIASVHYDGIDIKKNVPFIVLLSRLKEKRFFCCTSKSYIDNAELSVLECHFSTLIAFSDLKDGKYTVGVAVKIDAEVSQDYSLGHQIKIKNGNLCIE